MRIETQHNKVTGGKLYRITPNIAKLIAVFCEHEYQFESFDEDEIYKLLTKRAMNEEVTNDIIQHDEIKLLTKRTPKRRRLL